MSEATLLYLSESDVAATRVGPARLRAALDRAFRLHAAGRTLVDPKRSLPVAPGSFFQSMSAVSSEMAVAGHKWVGVAAGNAERGLSTVNALVVLSDVQTGLPIAIVSANALTMLRTAAMSALAAQHLARPDSIGGEIAGGCLMITGYEGTPAAVEAKRDSMVPA